MKRLYRTEFNRKIGGVCGGIAEYLDMDPTIVRLLVIALALVTGCFPAIISYVAACIIIPLKSMVVNSPFH